MRLAIVQFAPVFGDLRETIGKLDPLFSTLEKTDLIVLPELANSGYNFDSRDQAFLSAEEVDHSLFVDYLTGISKAKNCHIVTGFNEKENGHLYSSSLLIGPGGTVGLYRKLHLFWNEKDIFSRGNLGLPVFDIGSCRIGMLVCFDWIFPEVWRILALKGADLICHPANIVLPYAQRVVPAYSIINRIFTVLVNRTGTEGSLTFTGQSLVCGPNGKILAHASEDREQVVYAEFDPLMARIKQITPRNDVFADRLPEEYRELLG
jgi:predicted amidohydrolase